MPMKLVEVPDILSTAQKPVLDSVINNFLRHTGIDDSHVFYEDQLNNNHQPNSAIGDVSFNSNVSFSNQDRLSLSFEEDVHEESRLLRKPGWNHEVPFFLDSSIGLKIAPSFTLYQTTVTLRNRADSKAKLSTWLNEIRRRTDMGRETFLTQSEYFFYIPVPALNLIADCYRTKNNYLDYGQTLTEYMRSCFTDNVTIVAGEGGVGATFAVKMVENRIQVILDEVSPRMEKTTDGQISWVAELTCKFAYYRPEAVSMRYPYIINNTLMPEQWWSTTIAPGLSDETGSMPNVFVDAQDTIINELPGIKLPVRVPAIDEEIVTGGGRNPGQSDFVTGDLTFDTETGWVPPPDWGVGDEYPPEYEHLLPTEMFNMTEIPSLTWSTNVINYVVDCAKKDQHLLNSIIRPIIYEDGNAFKPTMVATDECLDVYGNFIPNLTKHYTFSITLILDWGNLTNEQFDQLRQHPDFVKDIIKDFFPGLVDKYPAVNEPDKLPSDLLGDITTEVGQLVDQNLKGKSNIYMVNILNGRIMTYKDY